MAFISDLNCMAMRYGIDQRIKIESRQIRVFGLDEYNVWCVIPVRTCHDHYTTKTYLL